LIGISSVCFPKVFLIKFVHTFLVSLISVTCPGHPMFFITLRILSNSSLCDFLNLRLTLILLVEECFFKIMDRFIFFPFLFCQYKDSVMDLSEIEGIMCAPSWTHHVPSCSRVIKICSPQQSFWRQISTWLCHIPWHYFISSAIGPLTVSLYLCFYFISWWDTGTHCMSSRLSGFRN
jgi:hypothetical protein